MNAIAYSEILKEVCDLVGWDAEDLDGQQFRQARRAVSSAIAKAWDYTFWPQLTVCEQRTFHPIYDATETLSVGDFRYFPPTDAYYQALVAHSAHAPATLSGTTWETNLDYWSLASRSLSLDVWSSSETYSKGAQVYWTSDFACYQARANPPLGTPPSNAAYWAPITEMDPVIPYVADGVNPIGRVKGVYAMNPKVHRGADPEPWTPSENGLQIRSELNRPWVWYQLRVPVLTAEIWDSSQSFDMATEEDLVVAIPQTSRGEYPAYATVGLARAEIITADRVDVRADRNGDPATFWRDATYVDDGEDVTGFADAAGTAFRRIQRV